MSVTIESVRQLLKACKLIPPERDCVHLIYYNPSCHHNKHMDVCVRVPRLKPFDRLVLPEQRDEVLRHMRHKLQEAAIRRCQYNVSKARAIEIYKYENRSPSLRYYMVASAETQPNKDNFKNLLIPMPTTKISTKKKRQLLKCDSIDSI